MELSSLDLHSLIEYFNTELNNCYIKNIYSIDYTTIMITLHHSLKGEKRLVLSSGKGIWLTNFTLSKKENSKMVITLRKKLNKSKFSLIAQPTGERIVLITFQNRDIKYTLVGEFFGNGNIMLLDDDNNVITYLNKLEVKHREIKYGIKYVLPPSKGVDIFSISLNLINSIPNSDIEISRWLSRNFSLSKKYINEILFRANISLETICNTMDKTVLLKIYDAINELIKLIKTEKYGITVYENDKPIDFLPFEFKTYSTFHLVRNNSFNTSVDEVFVKEIVSHKSDDHEKNNVDKIKQYENSIKQQIKKRIEVNKTSELLKQIATNLTKEQFSDSVKIKNFLSQYPELKLNDGKEGYTIKINSKKFEVDYNQNNYSLASMFFDYVKILNKLYISIQDAEIKLISRKNQLSDKINDKKAEILNQNNTVVRKKLWYEKFRWFITSDGLLAIGGKDATSNDILIKRHTEENDLIFHAEIHGSPFFVLKGGKPDMENSIYEVGQSVISFSKAWKEGLSSIKAYWVNKNQVKLSAPSGMSMGKGSFMIEGKRNYIKNLDVKLAVGIKIENQNMLILSGSPQAIKKNAISGVIIVYDNSKLSDGAKKIKNELYKNLNPKYLPLLKELSIDDIIRAMPSGGIRILDSF